MKDLFVIIYFSIKYGLYDFLEGVAWLLYAQLYVSAGQASFVWVVQLIVQFELQLSGWKKYLVPDTGMLLFWIKLEYLSYTSIAKVWDVYKI